MDDNNTKKAVPEWAINLKKRFDDLDKTQAEFCRKYGIEKSTCSKWVNGVHTPNAYGREKLCEFLEVPDWNWFLSQDERDRLAADYELKRFLSTKLGITKTLGITISEEGLKNLQFTYNYLVSLGFDDVVDRYEASGCIADIATIIVSWNQVFFEFYQTLEPLLEGYSHAVNELSTSYREILETEHGKKIMGFLSASEELEEKTAELGKEFKFSLTGEFDKLTNVHFELYKAAPKEPKKVVNKEESAPHDEEASQERERKE